MVIIGPTNWTDRPTTYNFRSQQMHPQIPTRFAMDGPWCCPPSTGPPTPRPPWRPHLPVPSPPAAPCSARETDASHGGRCAAAGIRAGGGVGPPRHPPGPCAQQQRGSTAGRPARSPLRPLQGAPAAAGATTRPAAAAARHRALNLTSGRPCPVYVEGVSEGWAWGFRDGLEATWLLQLGPSVIS